MAVIVIFAVISVEQINRTSSSDLYFPISADLVNYTASNSSSKIAIPKSFVDEKTHIMNSMSFWMLLSLSHLILV